MRLAPDVSSNLVAPPPAPADAPGEPVRGEAESVTPKVHVRTFTRKVERARIAARGVTQIKAGFPASVLKASATFDNKKFKGGERRELLAYLRGGPVTNAEFTADDARMIAELQAGSGTFADGELRDDTMAVLFAMGFRFSDRKVMPWQVKLDFYPGEVEDLDAWNGEVDEKITKKGGGWRALSAPAGEGTIYVRVGRSIVASYRARGGPPIPVDDDGKHVAGPTTPGAYRLGAPHAHVTSSWYYSQIPWGAEIRESEGGYQYRSPGRSDWSWATKNAACSLKMPLEEDDFFGLPEVTHDGATFSIWNKNDFGPLAWNLVPSDMYVHTTPETEPSNAAASPPSTETSLRPSHGCIHIYPHERDEMMKQGYLAVSVPFTVRRWDEHLLPDQVRHEMLGR